MATRRDSGAFNQALHDLFFREVEELQTEIQRSLAIGGRLVIDSEELAARLKFRLGSAICCCLGEKPPYPVYAKAELIAADDGLIYIKSLVATKDFEGYELHHTAIRVLGERASMGRVLREAMAAIIN